MALKIDLESQNQHPPTNFTQYSNQQIDNLIYLLINYKDNNNQQLIDVYNVEYILNIIDKYKIQQIELKFKSYGERGVDIIEFIRIFLIVLQNKEYEIIYTTMSLIDLFKWISESIKISQYVRYSDLTAFICDYFVQKGKQTYKIETVKMPEQKKFNQSNQIREIDLSPPVLIGETDEQIKRFNVNSLRTDCMKHNNLYIQDGYYSEELKRIITLDSLTSVLKIYKYDCKQDQILKVDPKSEKSVFIMSFAYSDRQQRIGVTLQDLSLIFLDWADKFQKQKIFPINSSTGHYQTQIWYIDMIETWVTTDKSNAINAWDLEYQRISWQLIDKEIIKNTVIDMKELTHAKLIAIASLDKKVTIWNFFTRAYVLTIDLTGGGVHHIAYSHNYQVLVTVGYENVINIFSISPLYIDYNKEGTLVGHQSMVTAVELVHNTPMLISADDFGIVKLWDIRNMKCIQTLNIGSKSTINKIINIPYKNIACFLGSRLTILEFDKSNTQQLDTENFYPIKTEYNKILEQLVVATRKDIRFINIKDGKVQKILTGLLQEEDEIVEFKQINQFKMFIIADQKGRLTMFNFNNGEEVKQLERHQNEVSNLFIDYTNKLVISSSWDSSIIIQSETQFGFEIKRMIQNSNNKKQIQHLEICLYHNLIVTGSNDNKIYIYDFEYVRLIGCIDLPNNVEPSCLSFINGFQILMVGSNDGKIYFIHLFTSELKIIYNILCVIDLLPKNRYYYREQQTQPSPPKYYAVKLLQNIKISQPDNIIQKCLLYIGMSNGLIQIFDLKEVLLKMQLKFVQHANTKNNYNPYRQVTEDFMNQSKQIDKQSFNIDKFIKDKQESIHFLNELDRLKEFQAHKDVILQLHFIDIGQEKNIFTCSSDKFVKIWDQSGNLQASVNINHPLPVYWDLNLEKMEKQKQKILTAFKILDITKQRYQQDKILDNVLQVNNFIGKLMKNLTQIDPKCQNKKNNNSVKLMQDEFSPRDLKYKEVRPFFESELRGKSLRQMEVTYGIVQRQQQQQNDQMINNTFCEQMNDARKVSENKESLIFLQNNFKNRVLKQLAEKEMDDKCVQLNEKMEKITNKNHKEKKRTVVKNDPKAKKEDDVKFQVQEAYHVKGLQISDNGHQLANKQFEATQSQFQAKKQEKNKQFFDYASDKKLCEPFQNFNHTSSKSMNTSSSLVSLNNQKSKISQIMKNLDKQKITAQYSVFGNFKPKQTQNTNFDSLTPKSDKFKTTYVSGGNSKLFMTQNSLNSIQLFTLDQSAQKLPYVKIGPDFKPPESDSKVNNKSNMYFQKIPHHTRFKTQPYNTSNAFNLPNLNI